VIYLLVTGAGAPAPGNQSPTFSENGPLFCQVPYGPANAAEGTADCEGTKPRGSPSDHPCRCLSVPGWAVDK
jgi:hypothetical protein